MALFTGVQHLCTFNIATPLFITFCQMWGKRRTPSARPSLLMLCSTDKFISYVVPGPSQWFFHFDEEIVIAWTHIGWVRWMFQNLPLPAVQEVHDSRGMTPCFVMKNNGVLYHQVSSFSPESMRLRSQRTTVRDPVVYNTKYELIRAIGRWIRNINKGGHADSVRRLPNIS